MLPHEPRTNQPTRGTADIMANKKGQEALRGLEREVFHLISEIFTPKQWAWLLGFPLERAVAQGNRGLAQKLVEAGATTGYALHEAVRGGHGDILEDLVDSGASHVVKGDIGETALHIAAHRGETAMVRLLLCKGADRDALDTDDRTPLYLAVRNNKLPAASRCGSGRQPCLRGVHGGASHGACGHLEGFGRARRGRERCSLYGVHSPSQRRRKRSFMHWSRLGPMSMQSMKTA